MLQAGNKEVCARKKSTIDDQQGKIEALSTRLKHLPMIYPNFSFHASTIRDSIVLMSAHLQRQPKLLHCYRRHTDRKKLTKR